MHWNLLTLRRLLLLLVCCGGPTSLPAQSLALSAPTRPLPYGSELKQQERVALTEVLSQLEDDHDIRFNYASRLVEDKTVRKDRVTADIDLEKQLIRLLAPLGLRFEKVNAQIYGIYPAPQPKAKQKVLKDKQSHLREAQLDLIARLGLRPLQTVSAAEQTISGTVTDEEGEGLPGVNVLVKSSTIGTVTDIEGQYTLSAPDDAETLVFSSVGYLSEEVAINGQSTIDLTMEPDVKSLEEVVVVGYGTQKKSDLTGSVASVAPEDINRVSERRLETALQGRAAGVQVARGEGSPGSESKVTIRGAGSIGDTGPLYVIDGVPQDPGNYFNMNDVESIEILKDASAAAIYGARAAHGVVLITTKRGAEGKINVSLNASVGQRQAVNLPDMLDRDRFIAASTTARQNAGQAPEDAWANPEGLPDTDWVDEMFDGGLEQTYNLSISGGNENANFFISGAYDRENGIMIDNYFERYSVRANSDFKIGKYIKVGESLLVSRTQENPTTEDGRDLENVFRAIPIMPVRDPSNPFGGWGTAPTYFQGGNPVARQLQNHINDQYTRLNGNLYAEIEPLEGLTLRGSFGANISAQLRNEFNEAFSYGSLSNSINYLTYRSADDEAFNTNLVLTYTNTIGDHNFTVLGGFERFTRDGIQFAATAQDFPLAFAESFRLANGEVDISERNTTDDQYRLQSLFGRINYTYANKYLLTANVRRDGSSRFSPENQYGVFPSLSVGWRIIEEEFMQNATFLSDLKLRASYGILGSDRIDDYIYSRNYSNDRSSYVFDASGVAGGTKVRGYYLRRFPNTQVKWEEVRQLDVGVDLGLLEGRFNLTADYYVKSTTDVLIGVQLPQSFGVSQNRDNPENPPFNLGELENRGIELGLNYRQNVNDWTFDISANAAWNQNEVKQLNEDDLIFNGGGGAAISGNVAITEVGQPLGTFYGLVADGIIQDEAQLQQLNDGAPDGVYQNNETAPGDLLYRDINGDGEITPDDRDYIGNPWPRMTYGLNANINYKAFDLTLFFQGVQGVDIFNATKPYFRSIYNDYNTSEQVFESWTAENPTDQPRLILSDPNGNFRLPSSYFVEDGSYLKLRNVQVGFTIPETLSDRIGLTRARVFVNAQNILTLTRYEGLDPELSAGNGNNTRQGIDNLGQYPQTRLISAGIQLGF